jgi:hypothetical protein
LCPPLRGTFAAGRQIAFLGIVTGEAEAHRHEGDGRLIVERRPVNAHPIAEAVTGCIIERQAGVVHAHPRCLPADGDARTRRHPHHWSRLMGELATARRIPADPARPDVSHQAIQVRCHHCTENRR